MATAFIYAVTNAVNQYGTQVNLQAYKGTNFLIISWIATALPLIAPLLWGRFFHPPKQPVAMARAVGIWTTSEWRQ